ncbi:MAG: segregation and condensation protein A [Gammaproteobacteria bacterium]|nr:segregation and condensation protein A [Gammaproteobacteria bacterium]
MSEEAMHNERAIMIMMRKTLSGIIRDVTPLPGMQSPLKDETVEDIRRCLGVIAAREQEIAKALGRDIRERPRFRDEPRTSHVVSFKKSGDKKDAAENE